MATEPKNQTTVSQISGTMTARKAPGGSTNTSCPYHDPILKLEARNERGYGKTPRSAFSLTMHPSSHRCTGNQKQTSYRPGGTVHVPTLESSEQKPSRISTDGRVWGSKSRMMDKLGVAFR